MDDFEKTLMQISKPQITELKHQELLAETISKIKHRNVLNLWWLSIPVYIACMLFMKSYFMPHSTLNFNIEEFKTENKYLSPLLFIAIPILLSIINILSIRKIYLVFGKLRTFQFAKTVIVNIVTLIISLIILTIYLI
ncbi:hypothetical protein [Mucilaginibacter arboris]|uniref:Uncharacterized protein n=1 Tax=Mucilaginibacter arboris TaxID=2682090 RepID=A0A7K1SUG8_9SPHI|nr:hypothetical protein [Mucilaginibacter arboris]MVN20934.1 hypothetical protein [Mucilaginibacter arboris]